MPAMVTVSMLANLEDAFCGESTSVVCGMGIFERPEMADRHHAELDSMVNAVTFFLRLWKERGQMVQVRPSISLGAHPDSLSIPSNL
jgi:hypothetical protein